jgi:hypothetical protein
MGGGASRNRRILKESRSSPATSQIPHETVVTPRYDYPTAGYTIETPTLDMRLLQDGLISTPMINSRASTPEVGVVFVTPRREISMRSSMSTTPTGQLMASYPYYCPLCMEHFSDILYTPQCCGNYICAQCCIDYIATQGIITNTGSINESLNKLQRECNAQTMCPQCMTCPFLPAKVELGDPTKDYRLSMQSPIATIPTATATPFDTPNDHAQNGIAFGENNLRKSQKMTIPGSGARLSASKDIQIVKAMNSSLSRNGIPKPNMYIDSYINSIANNTQNSQSQGNINIQEHDKENQCYHSASSNALSNKLADRSPLKAGDSFEELKRKMKPFAAIQSKKSKGLSEKSENSYNIPSPNTMVNNIIAKSTSNVMANALFSVEGPIIVNEEDDELENSCASFDEQVRGSSPVRTYVESQIANAIQAMVV